MTGHINLTPFLTCFHQCTTALDLPGNQGFIIWIYHLQHVGFATARVTKQHSRERKSSHLVELMHMTSQNSCQIPSVRCGRMMMMMMMLLSSAELKHWCVIASCNTTNNALHKQYIILAMLTYWHAMLNNDHTSATRSLTLLMTLLLNLEHWASGNRQHLLSLDSFGPDLLESLPLQC